jgi:hypothetical protein
MFKKKTANSLQRRNTDHLYRVQKRRKQQRHQLDKAKI